MNFPQLRYYDVSHAILTGYVEYYYQFKRITKRARYRFEARDWHGIQADARERITLYRDCVGNTTEKVRAAIGEEPTDDDFWRKVQAAFRAEIIHFNTRSIVETFYNSVFRHAHQGLGANADLMFVVRTGSYRELSSLSETAYSFSPHPDQLADTVREIMTHFPFDAPFEDLERDTQLVANRWRDTITEIGGVTTAATVEMLHSVFYRNKCAYLVGRFSPDGKRLSALHSSLDSSAGAWNPHRCPALGSR